MSCQRSSFFEMLEAQMVAQWVEVPKIVVGLAVSSGGVWVFWARKERHD